MRPVHFMDPGHPGLLQPYPYRIGRLTHLPTRYLRFAPERRQIGIDFGGGLVHQLAPRMGRDACLGPDHEPAVEGWLNAWFHDFFGVPSREGAALFLMG